MDQTHPTTPPQTSGLAITSLVLGLVSIFGLCLTALPAMICGWIALSKIKKSGGTLGGKGLAIGGIIAGPALSFPAIVVMAGLAVPTAMKALDKAEQVRALSQVKQLRTAITDYETLTGSYPTTLDSLVPDPIATKFELYEMKTIDLGSGKTEDVVYLSGFSSTSPNETIILYSPAFNKEQRVVSRVDGSTSLADDLSFRAQLTAQGSPQP